MRIGALHLFNRGDNTLVRLPYSKNRLEPVKWVMLPKFELLAGLLGTGLLINFCSVTSYDSTQEKLWL
jgi:hypothetical protein